MLYLSDKERKLYLEYIQKHKTFHSIDFELSKLIKFLKILFSKLIK